MSVVCVYLEAKRSAPKSAKVNLLCVRVLCTKTEIISDIVVGCGGRWYGRLNGQPTSDNNRLTGTVAAEKKGMEAEPDAFRHGTFERAANRNNIFLWFVWTVDWHLRSMLISYLVLCVLPAFTHAPVITAIFDQNASTNDHVVVTIVTIVVVVVDVVRPPVRSPACSQIKICQ